MSWYQWVGDFGAIVGLDHFGASAPYQTLYKEFGADAGEGGGSGQARATRVADWRVADWRVNDSCALSGARTQSPHQRP